MSSLELMEELNCSICLSIYTDPVMLKCEHNFCQSCIGNVLDTQEGSGVYSCPECRAEFQDRPILQRNRKLCNIVTCFLSTQPKQEITPVFCTYCDSPVPAVKSCLRCDASLCEKHLKKHSTLEKHILIEPITNPENRKCSTHKKLLEYYCSEDSACVCVSCCLAGEHMGHQVELLKEASGRKKIELRHVVQKLYSKGEKTEEKVQWLQKQRVELKERVACVTESVTVLFRNIREQLEVLEKRVLSEVIQQEEHASLSISDLIKKLQIKKDKLSRKSILIEELCNITDPLTFLRKETDNKYDRDTDNDDDNNEDNFLGSLDEAPISIILHRGILRLADILFSLSAKSQLHVLDTPDILPELKTACSYVDDSEYRNHVSSVPRDQQWPDEWMGRGKRTQKWGGMGRAVETIHRPWFDVEKPEDEMKEREGWFDSATEKPKGADKSDCGTEKTVCEAESSYSGIKSEELKKDACSGGNSEDVEDNEEEAWFFEDFGGGLPYEDYWRG